MIDNFALLFAHLAMIVVLWRCYVMPDDGEAKPQNTGVWPKKSEMRARRRKVKFKA